MKIVPFQKRAFFPKNTKTMNKVDRTFTNQVAYSPFAYPNIKISQGTPFKKTNCQTPSFYRSLTNHFYHQILLTHEIQIL